MSRCGQSGTHVLLEQVEGVRLLFGLLRFCLEVCDDLLEVAVATACLARLFGGVDLVCEHVERVARQPTRARTGARAAATEAVGRATSLGELLTGRINARSGVDIDAEVAAMVQLQTAYGVNARVISTIQAMWDSLFNAVR